MTPEERYAEKIRARAAGTVPVITQAPEAPTGNTPEAIAARYQEKLRRHGKPDVSAKPAAAPADKPDEGKVESKQPKGEGKKTDKPDEGKSKNDSGKGDQSKG